MSEQINCCYCCFSNCCYWFSNLLDNQPLTLMLFLRTLIPCPFLWQSLNGQFNTHHVIIYWIAKSIPRKMRTYHMLLWLEDLFVNVHQVLHPISMNSTFENFETLSLHNTWFFSYIYRKLISLIRWKMRRRITWLNLRRWK